MNLKENYVFGVCNDKKADDNEVVDDYDNTHKVNGFLPVEGFKFIGSIFVKRKNMCFICGEHRP